MRVRTSVFLTAAALLASACASGSEQPAPSSARSTVPVTTSPDESENPPPSTDVEDQVVDVGDEIADSDDEAATIDDDVVDTDEEVADTDDETADSAIEHGWKPSLDPVYDVTATTDIVYGQGEVDGGGTFDDLLLDLYVPEVAGQDRFPLVVTIHGGGFNGGSKANTAFVSDQFAQRGYIVASIDYRLSGDDPIPSARMQPGWDAIGGADATAQARAAIAAMDDTMTALDFLHARPDVESSQTVLWGSSAGAITAAYVGYAMDDFGIERPPVSAVISNSGGFIGEASSAETFIEGNDGATESPDSYSEGPIFMTHATGDPVVPYQLSQDIVDRAEAVGHPYERFTADADSHGVPGGIFQTEFSPGVSVFQAQVNWLDGFLVGVAETS